MKSQRQDLEQALKEELDTILGRQKEVSQAPAGDASAPTSAAEQPSDEHVESQATMAVWRAESPPRDLCGLALSGGGIRSATFNLGLLQELHDRGLLGSFDYLATVSGGGYIGSFWSAWRQRNPGRTFPERGSDEPEAPEIRHLREFSNHLRPRLSLLSFETGRIAAVLFGALLPSLLTAASVIALILLAWLGLVWEVTARGLGEGVATLAGILLLVHIPVGIATAARRRNTEEPYRLGHAFYWFLWFPIGMTITLAAWWMDKHLEPLPFPLIAGPITLADFRGARCPGALLPALAFLVAILMLTLLRWMFSRFAREVKSRRCWQGSLDAVLARHSLVAALWTVIGLLWISGQLVAGEGITGLASAIAIGAGGASFTVARQFFRAQPNKPTGGRLSLLAAPAVLKVLATLALAAAMVTVAALLTLVYRQWGADGQRAVAGAALGVLALTLLFFDPREVGFHSFYRARLVRSYLGASNPDVQLRRATAECTSDDLRLDELAKSVPLLPLQLVCCTANDLSGDPLGTLHRGAESAVLTPFGFQLARHFGPWHGDATSLGAAMTASGAAFNSHMGSASMGLGAAATFLLATLNVRLGLWMENPGHKRCGKWRLASLLPGLFFFRELFGLSDLTSRHVYLSDGGHFENLGIYELVRRHCRFIVVSDCGADPDVAFDDLGTAVRRAREDFGVEIRIDVSPLRPDAGGRSRQAAVAGDINYPDGDCGVLLYVKPALVGDEPPDVVQYAGRNATFPHETTVDQFFDEAQWEAYRRLGAHVASSAFSRVDALMDATSTRLNLPLALGHARLEWMPELTVDGAELQQLEEAWTELENHLGTTVLPLRDRILLGAEPAKMANGAADGHGESMVDALPYICRALTLIESTWRICGLGGAPRSGHFGWLNRIGRWVRTSDFRFWWPWLAPLHSRQLVEYLEDVLDAPRLRALVGTLTDVDLEHERGYAAAQWRTIHGNRQRAGQRTFGYSIPLDGNGSQPLLAAIILYTDEQGERRWDDDDFFIPAGLWRIGLGERVIREVVRSLPLDLSRIVVRLVSGRISSVNMAIYAGQGFVWQSSGEARNHLLWTRPAGEESVESGPSG